MKLDKTLIVSGLFILAIWMILDPIIGKFVRPAINNILYPPAPAAPAAT